MKLVRPFFRIVVIILALFVNFSLHAQDKPALVVVLVIDGLPQEQVVKYQIGRAHV